MNHLDRLLKKLEELGMSPTQEQLTELAAMQEEIDRLIGIIKTSQEAFGQPKLYLPVEESSIECCSTGYCSCDSPGLCCSPACFKDHE